MGGNKFCYLIYLIFIAGSQIFGDHDSNVDNFGHAGGFLTGAFLTCILYEEAWQNEHAKKVIPFLFMGFLLLYGFLIYMMFFSLDTSMCPSVLCYK